PAFAQQADKAPGLGLKGIGFRLGLADPEDASSALLMGVHLDAGEFVRNVHLVPSIEYWNVGNDVGPYSADFSDLAFRLGINFDFPLQDQRMVPYLGGGLGVHHFSVDSNVPGFDGDSETKLGLDVQGGARNQFTPNLSLFGELGYSFVSDANQLRLLGGLTYHFIY
ncbi:MAG TPA: outer membrane beta-barrel protein, partial [Candidatus Eisenbacteria bacterium]|nr:outer membrane beta-barrel protein [Candidatus Eisenbacteria bacterium]